MIPLGVASVVLSILMTTGLLRLILEIAFTIFTTIDDFVSELVRSSRDSGKRGRD